MRPMLIATLLSVISVIVLLPVANALTPRSDFSDNVSTYNLFGNTRVCGEHLCDPGQWNIWLNNLLSSQFKKFNDLSGIKSPPNTIKSASYDSSLANTSSGEISGVTTFAMNDGKFTSFVSVTNNGPRGVNHIAISQLNPGVKTLKAWITPQWNSNISLYHITFDTSKSSFTQEQTLNLVIVTDGKPSFSLDTLAAN